MRPQYKLAAGLLGILMSLVSPVSTANLLSEDSAVKSEYMEAQRDSEVYALVGEHVIPVGEVKRGQLIRCSRRMRNTTNSNSGTAPALSIKTTCVS